MKRKIKIVNNKLELSDDLELIFTMLGEAATTEITRVKDARGFDRNKQAASEGGSVAGKARKDLETKTGKKVSTRKNYLRVPERMKRLRSSSY